jgi:hypothetical protein
MEVYIIIKAPMKTFTNNGEFLEDKAPDIINGIGKYQ